LITAAYASLCQDLGQGELAFAYQAGDLANHLVELAWKRRPKNRDQRHYSMDQ